jgi:hypothetical protein
MVRRRNVSKRSSVAFTASGRVSGVDVTVSRVGEVTRGLAGDFNTPGALYEVLPPSSVTGRVPITGYLLPATFRVDGLTYDLTYDVGLIVDGKRQRYGVTRFIAGTTVDAVATIRNPAAASVAVDGVTEAALVRLALRATIVHGYAYEPGSVVDPATGDIVGKVKVGDAMPAGVVMGVTTGSTVIGQKSGREITTTVTRRTTIRKAENGASVGAGVRVVALAERPVSVLRFRFDSHVNDADLRLLTGRRPAGRPRGEPITDADLRLLARLYDKAYADPTVTNVPDTVRLWLIAETNGRLTYGESWIRRQAVAARKAGYLKQGKRNKKRGRK